MRKTSDAVTATMHISMAKFLEIVGLAIASEEEKRHRPEDPDELIAYTSQRLFSPQPDKIVYRAVKRLKRAELLDLYAIALVGRDDHTSFQDARANAPKDRTIADYLCGKRSLSTYLIAGAAKMLWSGIARNRASLRSRRIKVKGSAGCSSS